MKHFIYDVFISYRRKGGAEKAQLVKSEIIQRGIEDSRIFLDTHSLDACDFKLKIKVAIEQSEAIVVIISQGCFDEVKETDFWYMEIKEALILGKRIIPVLFDGITSFENLDVPKELNTLTKMNAVTYQHEYANAVFDKLMVFLEHEHELANKKRKGCLFKFKYKGCIVSVILFVLFCFVLFPTMLFDPLPPSDSEIENGSGYEYEEHDFPSISAKGGGYLDDDGFEAWGEVGRTGDNEDSCTIDE